MQKEWESFWQNQPSVSARGIAWSKRRMMILLEPYLTGKSHVLDAGCGSGFFSKYFLSKGMSTTALDYSQQALDLTEKATGGMAQLIRADLLTAPLAEMLPQRFDLIFSDGLLEHFPAEDQGRILKNFLSVLSPSGVVATFVPNRWSPWELVRPFLMPGITEEPFTLKRLIDLNERNGLEVIFAGGLNTLPFRFSPEGRFASTFGMLLYTLSTRK